MKSITVIILLAACIQGTYQDTLAQQPADSEFEDFLLWTNWGGEEFQPNTFIPDNHTPGCHSMAYAQIFNYHRMAPGGKVDYTSSKEYVIREDLNNYSPDWELMNPAGRSDSDSLGIREIQKYLYYVAATVGKDFGTGNYMTNFHKRQLKRHYDCRVKEYLRYRGLFLSKKKIRRILIEEIDAGRPVYFHYTNFNGGGHSVVADGYQVKDGILLVHLNFGWGGRSDGWYDPLGHIANPDDTILRIITTIHPKGT